MFQQIYLIRNTIEIYLFNSNDPLVFETNNDVTYESELDKIKDC